MLLYSYRIGGVDYESSQDITDMRGVVDAAQVRAGFPCSARYQPGNPHNSIVVAEEWSGLRAGLPVFPAYDDPDPVDTSHLESLRPAARLICSAVYSVYQISCAAVYYLREEHSLMLPVYATRLLCIPITGERDAQGISRFHSARKCC